MPNKVTSQVREVIARFAEENAERVGEWITRAAKKDPARAAELYLRALEFHIPKIRRTELTGADSEDTRITVQIVRLSEGPARPDFQPFVSPPAT